MQTRFIDVPSIAQENVHIENILCDMDYLPLNEDQLRNLINAETTFTALEDAKRRQATVRGSMFWRSDAGKEYLVRATPLSKQTRLGVRSSETEAIFHRFVERKAGYDAEVKSLAEALLTVKRYNFAARVGRSPKILVDILNCLEKTGVSGHFLTVGTHAMYAYETAAGVRVVDGALATQDVDILFDTRKRLTFFSGLKAQNLSFIDVLRKVDKTFRVRDDQLQTAVNARGFEVDVIRRMAKDGDPHPLRMSDSEDDLGAVQVSSGERMLHAARYSQIILATDGSMARMNTISPEMFARTKESLGVSRSRDARKRDKDLMQARIVRKLMNERGIMLRGNSPLWLEENTRPSHADSA